MTDEGARGSGADADTRAVFERLADRVGDGAVTRDRLITIVVDFAREDGVNLPRLVNGHPDLVEDYLGEPIAFDEAAVDLVDDALEGRLGPP